VSATEEPPQTIETAPSRRVKAANQPRWVGWGAALGASGAVLALLAYGVALSINSRLPPHANIVSLAFFTLLALWLWLNRVELELSPERIAIRSRWRHFVRPQPRGLVLPPDAAIVVEGGMVRVGGWSAGFWKLKRIAAVAKEAGVALDVRQRPMVRQTRTRRLGTTVGAVTLVAMVFVAPGIAVHVWDPNLSPLDLLEIAWSVWLCIASLGVLFLLRLRLRMERAVPGDAIEPIRRAV
jgi:hypothetical protein